MHTTWIVLLPPLLVLIAAFITHRLNPSLIVGILTAAVIAADFNLFEAAKLAFTRLTEKLIDPDYLYLYGFLFLIGIIIMLLSRTGGAAAFAQSITARLKSKRAVETSSLLLSFLLFIDDYLSSLTVGYVMRPLADRFNIPRAKLAFLVHSLSGPLVIMVPVSSWVAMITSQLDLAGIAAHGTTARINADPFFVYLSSIPFIFYSILTIASVWFIVRMNISFGPMHAQEQIAIKNGNLFGGKPALNSPIEHYESAQGSIIDLILPLVTLISSAFLGILYVGGFWLLGGNRSLLEALKNNNNTFFALFMAATITFIFSLIFALVRKKIRTIAVPNVVKCGIQLMQGAVLMVFLASILGTMLKSDLFVGTYLAHSIIGSLTPALLPFVFFIISAIVATITGSSWGTIAIMLPNTIQMLVHLLALPTGTSPEHIAILFPLLGAIFSGAVCGDHISPISETTIMASTSSGAYPIDHAYTQFFYALPAIVSSALAFLIAGFLAPHGMLITLVGSLITGLTSCIMLLWYCNNNV